MGLGFFHHFPKTFTNSNLLVLCLRDRVFLYPFSVSFVTLRILRDLKSFLQVGKKKEKGINLKGIKLFHESTQISEGCL